MADFLDADGWREEDAAWERLQRDVLLALLANDHPLARKHIGQASALAQGHFQTGDPRLAATLACQAYLFQDERPSLASDLFQDALAQWAQAPAWLALQPPPGRPKRRLARSSSFHLRLENKHPGAYQERLRETMKPLLTLARALTEDLRDGGSQKPGVRPALDNTAAGETAQKVKTAVDLLRACCCRAGAASSGY